METKFAKFQLRQLQEEIKTKHDIDIDFGLDGNEYTTSPPGSFKREKLTYSQVVRNSIKEREKRYQRESSLSSDESSPPSNQNTQNSVLPLSRDPDETEPKQGFRKNDPQCTNGTNEQNPSPLCNETDPKHDPRRTTPQCKNSTHHQNPSPLCDDGSDDNDHASTDDDLFEQVPDYLFDEFYHGYESDAEIELAFAQNNRHDNQGVVLSNRFEMEARAK